MIGITATVPVEIIYGAGCTPVDLNNLFITSPDPLRLISRAEGAGFSRNICAWIKGIYGAVLSGSIETVIAVTGGDCSNTIALAEVLGHKGVRVIRFEYPLDRDRETLLGEMDGLRRTLSTSWTAVERARARLAPIRSKLRRLDDLTHGRGLVTGGENHRFLVSSSDFTGDPEGFEQQLDRLLSEVRGRKPPQEEIRLGYLGVPPVFRDFYERIETLGARVVFNEVQRQFSMPGEERDLVEQYRRFTYPYDLQGRLDDIREAIRERSLDGLIHYTQTFCYRQIYDILFKELLDIPVLTLEGDRPGPVDGRTGLRIETFVEVLRSQKEQCPAV